MEQRDCWCPKGALAAAWFLLLGFQRFKCLKMLSFSNLHASSSGPDLVSLRRTACYCRLSQHLKSRLLNFQDPPAQGGWFPNDVTWYHNKWYIRTISEWENSIKKTPHSKSCSTGPDLKHVPLPEFCCRVERNQRLQRKYQNEKILQVFLLDFFLYSSLL